MKPPLSWLLRLYPAQWRARYEAELEALVDDRGGAWMYATDIVIEALKMRFVSVNWLSVGTFALAGLALAYSASFAIPNRYVSKAVLRIEPAFGEKATGSSIQELIRLQAEVLSRPALSNIIQHPGLNLYEKERASLPLEDVIERMKRRDLRISMEVEDKPRSDERLFTISFSSDQPGRASGTVEQIVRHFVDLNQERHAGRPSPYTITVLDPASLPRNPTSPNRLMIGVVGLLLGIVACVVTARLRRPNSTDPQTA